MMQEIIDITPEMMHKFYNNNNNELVDKQNSKYTNISISIELKMCILVLFIFPLIIYALSLISNNMTNNNYYQKLH